MFIFQNYGDPPKQTKVDKPVEVTLNSQQKAIIQNINQTTQKVDRLIDDCKNKGATIGEVAKALEKMQIKPLESMAIDIRNDVIVNALTAIKLHEENSKNSNKAIEEVKHAKNMMN